jgi:thiol-disulfide isomerase/thioredoxin
MLGVEPNGAPCRWVSRHERLKPQVEGHVRSILVDPDAPAARHIAAPEVNRNRAVARTLLVMHSAMRRSIGPLVVTAALLPIAAACTSGQSGAPSVTVALPTSPSALPPVTLAQFKGMLAAEAAKGRPVLLNVWNSVCGPCVREAPSLESLAGAYGSKVQFVGLDVNDVAPLAKAFIAKNRWSFPSVSDPRAAVRNGMGYSAQPVTILFDTHGKQVYFQAGDITIANIRSALQKLTANA